MVDRRRLAPRRAPARAQQEITESGSLQRRDGRAPSPAFRRCRRRPSLLSEAPPGATPPSARVDRVGGGGAHQRARRPRAALVGRGRGGGSRARRRRNAVVKSRRPAPAASKSSWRRSVEVVGRRRGWLVASGASASWPPRPRPSLGLRPSRPRPSRPRTSINRCRGSWRYPRRCGSPRRRPHHQDRSRPSAGAHLRVVFGGDPRSATPQPRRGTIVAEQGRGRPQ